MILYHGSNVEVQKPRLFRNDRRADFGPGFYLTSSFEQARRWARLVTERRDSGSPTVSVFEFDEYRLDELAWLRFDSASVEWLAYVGSNRRGAVDEDHDLVIGPVANDATMPTLRLYFADILDEEETIRRLLPQRLKDQFAFKTQRAIDMLEWKEAEYL